MVRRRVSPEDGLRTIRAWCEEGENTSHDDLMTAVRYSLEELGDLYPGRSVEVRVPPAGAVQIISGTTHRRGTPPAVIEADMHTWLRLVTGDLPWDQAVSQGLVQASGERADLAGYVPLDL